MKKIIILLGILLISNICFGIPAIKLQESPFFVYTNLDTANSVLTTVNVCDLGDWNDPIFTKNENENFFIVWLGTKEQQKISDTIENEIRTIVFEVKSDSKNLYLKIIKNYKKNKYNKWGLKTIFKTVEVK